MFIFFINEFSFSFNIFSKPISFLFSNNSSICNNFVFNSSILISFSFISGKRFNIMYKLSNLLFFLIIFLSSIKNLISFVLFNELSSINSKILGLQNLATFLISKDFISTISNPSIIFFSLFKVIS